MDNKPSVSVILPAFNEEAILEASLQEVHAYLGGLSERYDWEIVVVNDGSTDSTAEIAEKFASMYERVRVLHHFVNFNLGQALRFAFNHCDSDFIITIDSDLSYAPEHIGQLLDAMETTRAKIVIASPYMKGGRATAVPLFRLFLSRCANRFLALTARQKLSTLTGMARAYDRRFLQTLDLKAMDVEINTEIIYKAQLLRAKVVEIPAHLDWSRQKEVEGRRGSSIRIFRSVSAYGLSGFLFHPFLFFTAPGLVAFALALYTLSLVVARVIDHYVESGGPFDPEFGRAVAVAFAEAPHAFFVGGVALLVALQLLMLGVLAAQAKRYFEELFHLGTTIYRQTRVLEDRDFFNDSVNRARQQREKVESTRSSS